MARGIDHLVLPVRDLDAAAAHYQALGFQVGALNRHPWGTENRLIQFPGCFLELITAGGGMERRPETPGRFDFGERVAAFLETHGDGFAMIVVESRDADADKAAYDQGGIGGFERFDFAREGRGPDGEPVTVSFSLAFAASKAMPHIGFFACKQARPELFWSETKQRHDNGATKFGGAIIITDDPARDAPFLEAFTATPPVCVGPRNAAFTTPRGSLELMTPECFGDVVGIDCGLDAEAGPRAVAFRVSAPADAFTERCIRLGLPVTRRKRSAVLPAAANFGTALVIVDR